MFAMALVAVQAVYYKRWIWAPIKSRKLVVNAAHQREEPPRPPGRSSRARVYLLKRRATRSPPRVVYVVYVVYVTARTPSPPPRPRRRTKPPTRRRACRRPRRSSRQPRAPAWRRRARPRRAGSSTPPPPRRTFSSSRRRVNRGACRRRPRAERTRPRLRDERLQLRRTPRATDSNFAAASSGAGGPRARTPARTRTKASSHPISSARRRACTERARARGDAGFPRFVIGRRVIRRGVIARLLVPSTPPGLWVAPRGPGRSTTRAGFRGRARGRQGVGGRGGPRGRRGAVRGRPSPGARDAGGRARGASRTIRRGDSSKRFSSLQVRRGGRNESETGFCPTPRVSNTLSAPPPEARWVKRARSRRKTCSGSRGCSKRASRAALPRRDAPGRVPPRGSETRGKRTHVSTLFLFRARTAPMAGVAPNDVQHRGEKRRRGRVCGHGVGVLAGPRASSP